jgi:putative two-component system response regulator
MHDVGKIGVPEEFLQKPGKLTDDEFKVIMTHCDIGAEIIGEHNSELLKAARVVALQHHEKWDGTGYPNRLSGNAIHIFARITAVADVFDALTSKRPYKDAWSCEKAAEYIIQQSGKHFDPQVVEAFKNCLQDIYTIKNALRD